MKAITLVQPYATLIALGYKHYETRGWQTSLRGPLAIHAGLGTQTWARQVCETDPIIRDILTRHNLTFETLPRGRVLAIAQVSEMLRIVSVAHADSPHEVAPSQLTPEERACGDYTPGRWAWALGQVQVLAEPVACSGAQSIWQVPADIAQRIEQAL
jgi:hypothetical protein